MTAPMPRPSVHARIVLPYLGALPFVVCAGLLVLGWPLPAGFQTGSVLGSYGLAIVCFMAGVHWGQHLSGQSIGFDLPLLSNGIVLAAWFSWLFLTAPLFFIALALLFAILLWVDWRFFRAGLIDPTYWATRMRVTGLVEAALWIAATSI